MCIHLCWWLREINSKCLDQEHKSFNGNLCFIKYQRILMEATPIGHEFSSIYFKISYLLWIKYRESMQESWYTRNHWMCEQMIVSNPIIKSNNLLLLGELFKLNDLPCFYSREGTYTCYHRSADKEYHADSKFVVFLCPVPASSFQNSGLLWNWID